MTEFLSCPGLDEAIIGTFANEHDVVVPVYDVNKVFTMFGRQNKSQDHAIEWITDVLESWSEQVRPIFINYNPKLAASVMKQKAGRVN